MQIPDFLKPFENQFLPTKVDVVKIHAKPNKSNPLPLKTSKFLGLPFLPNHISYPIGKDGLPMLPLAQLVLNEIPLNKYLPQNGILQFYISASDWYSADDVKVIYIEDDYDESKITKDFSFLTPKLFEDSPIENEHELTFELTEEVVCYTDYRFNIDFNGLDWCDYSETLDKDQTDKFYKIFDGNGHKIGGYSYFTQSDFRDYEDNSDEYIQLLQIDSENEIMFGDVGVCHFFIKKDDLKKKDFNQVRFEWDCC